MKEEGHWTNWCVSVTTMKYFNGQLENFNSHNDTQRHEHDPGRVGHATDNPSANKYAMTVTRLMNDIATPYT